MGMVPWGPGTVFPFIFSYFLPGFISERSFFTWYTYRILGFISFSLACSQKWVVVKKWFVHSKRTAKEKMTPGLLHIYSLSSFLAQTVIWAFFAVPSNHIVKHAERGFTQKLIPILAFMWHVSECYKKLHIDVDGCWCSCCCCCYCCWVSLFLFFLLEQWRVPVFGEGLKGLFHFYSLLFSCAFYPIKKARTLRM